MRSRLLIIAAGVIAVATVAAATTGRIGRDDGPAPTAHAATTAERTPQRAQAPRDTIDDATIVAIFDAANTADIETGALAAERGASTEVRDFGAMLATTHRAVRQQGRDLAKRLGVTPTPPRDDAGARAHAAAMARLQALEGAAFDRAFLRHEVEFHASVLDAVEGTLLPAIENAELRALVEKVAPALEAHRLGAENLERRLAETGRR